MNKKEKILLALKATLCCALWGISTPIVKIGYRYVDGSDVASLILWLGIEFVIAGIFAIIVGSITEKKFLRPKKQSIMPVIKISLLQTVLQYVFIYIGCVYTTSVKASVLKCTDVFFIMLISSVLFKQEKLTPVKIISCLIGFSGIVLINLNGLSLDFTLRGDGAILLGIVFYSLAVVLTKPYSQKEDPMTLCSYQMTAGGLVLLAIGACFGGTMDFAGALPIILGLSAAYGIAYSLWTCLLKKYPVSRVSIYGFSTPIFGVAFSWLILNEKNSISPVNLTVSLILVCGGIILWSRDKSDDGTDA